MKSKYFDKVTALLKKARPGLATTYQLEFKNCFGAIAGYVNGHIFISCGRFGVALKLPPKILGSLLKEGGGKHLKYFPKGHIKKEYVLLPKRIIENKQKFKKLVDESIKYALVYRKQGSG